MRSLTLMLGEGRLRELGRQLLEEPNWVSRAKAAEQLGHLLCTEALSEADRSLAEEYIRLSRFDEEMLVRRVIAESLKRAERLSRDTLLVLAADRGEVAAPLIEHSPLFSEDDLLRILDNRSAAHCLALARRFAIAEQISAPLLATGDELLITTLLRNRGATIGEDQLWRLIAKPPLRPRIVDALLRRRGLLPPRILAAIIELRATLSDPGQAAKWCMPGEGVWRAQAPDAPRHNGHAFRFRKPGEKRAVRARPKAAQKLPWRDAL